MRSIIREMLMSALLLRTIVFALAILGADMDASAVDALAMGVPPGFAISVLAPDDLLSDALTTPPAATSDDQPDRQPIPLGTVVAPDGFTSPALDGVAPGDGSNGMFPLIGPSGMPAPVDISNEFPADFSGAFPDDFSDVPVALPGPPEPYICGLMPSLDGLLPDDGMARVLATCAQQIGMSDATLAAIGTPPACGAMALGAKSVTLATDFAPAVLVPPG